MVRIFAAYLHLREEIPPPQVKPVKVNTFRASVDAKWSYIEFGVSSYIVGWKEVEAIKQRHYPDTRQ